MRNPCPIALLALLVVCLPSCRPGQPASEGPTAAAERFVDLLAAGDFATAVQGFDKTMAGALTADKLKASWDTVVTQAGPFQKRLSSQATKAQGYDIVVVACQFAKAPLDIKVVFDAQGKVSGLWMAPSGQSGGTAGPAPASGTSR
jgi:hypothetical protein